jgi:hypothetical protein
MPRPLHVHVRSPGAGARMPGARFSCSEGGGRVLVGVGQRGSRLLVRRGWGRRVFEEEERGLVGQRAPTSSGALRLVKLCPAGGWFVDAIRASPSTEDAPLPRKPADRRFQRRQQPARARLTELRAGLSSYPREFADESTPRPHAARTCEWRCASSPVRPTQAPSRQA